jgi:microsomal dipeptidase-like Zn-dependent dipeptidase
VGWRVLAGGAQTWRPIAAPIRADHVLIDDQPVVPLGGNYWHLDYPIGVPSGHKLIRTSSTSAIALESRIFKIARRYLVFLLGGSGTTDVAVELRIPAKIARKPFCPPLDRPDTDGFVAVMTAKPTGSDVLSQYVWDLGAGLAPLTKVQAKVRLRILGTSTTPRRLSAALIRLQDDQPAPFHVPVWGFADLHCHPMAQAAFGGVMAGHMHGPVEDLGSCLQAHGSGHSNPLHPVAMANGKGGNDGSLTTTGWTTGSPAVGEQLEFGSWPVFDDLVHIKTHQDWIRRAYDGGLRLMVTLVVHNELITALNCLTTSPQRDRDIIEPQVQMLHEFVTHNSSWCGLAKTAHDARSLIEQNKLAFVLGLETDSINGWMHFDPANPMNAASNDFTDDGSDANRAAISQAMRLYFEYLRNLGIVQINLVHLSDNDFGGMALYDAMFLVNTFNRTGHFPSAESGVVPGRSDDEQIYLPVTLESELFGPIVEAAAGIGITIPATIAGSRNTRSMTVAGEVAIREAMRLGMVLDIDHMSEKCSGEAHRMVTTLGTDHPYPLISAHNGARTLSPRPLGQSDPPKEGHRRKMGYWPSEGSKSETQLGYILETGGMLGHGTALGDMRIPDAWQAPNVNPCLVANNCPGTVKTFAQGYAYVRQRLAETPVAFGTDWNVLLACLGPRFGPRSAGALKAEVGAGDLDWQRQIAVERRRDAESQYNGVRYQTDLTRWRADRFTDDGLYNDYGTGPHATGPVPGDGPAMWQAVALAALARTVALAPISVMDSKVLQMVAGLQGSSTTPQTDYWVAGAMAAGKPHPTSTDQARALATQLGQILGQWNSMTGDNLPLQRSTAGHREFDINLDGMAHYGMLPDLIQDLCNVGMDQASLSSLFGSAEQYLRVWEMCDHVASQIKP